MLNSGALLFDRFDVRAPQVENARSPAQRNGTLALGSGAILLCVLKELDGLVFRKSRGTESFLFDLRFAEDDASAALTIRAIEIYLPVNSQT